MKITVTIPGHLASKDDVVQALDDFMQLAGGVTITCAQGRWLAPNGERLDEPVECYKFVVPDHLCSLGGGHAKTIAELLVLTHGEQAVLVEYSHPRNNSEVLYTKEDFA